MSFRRAVMLIVEGNVEWTTLLNTERYQSIWHSEASNASRKSHCLMWLLGRRHFISFQYFLWNDVTTYYYLCQRQAPYGDDYQFLLTWIGRFGHQRYMVSTGQHYGSHSLSHNWYFSWAIWSVCHLTWRWYKLATKMWHCQTFEQCNVNTFKTTNSYVYRARHLTFFFFN